MLLSVLFLQSAFAQIQAVKPWLGIGLEDHPAGVAISLIVEESPAKNSNLQAKDVVFRINDKKVNSPRELIQVIQSFEVGSKVIVYYYRNDKSLKESITLVPKPSLSNLAKKMLIGKAHPELKISKNEKFKFNNKVTILEFWEVWCPSCQSSMNRVIKFSNENKDKIEVHSFYSDQKIKVKKF